jgi:hypothetical protein
VCVCVCVFFRGRGFYYRQAAQRVFQKNADPPLARTWHLRTHSCWFILHPVTAVPQSPNRRRAPGRRDRHVAAVPGTPAVCVEPTLEHQTRWRATYNWPLPLCPPHVSTPPPPTQAERTSALFFFGCAYSSRCLYPVGTAHPALMGRAAHSVEAKVVIRIEVAVSPCPCLGCAVELALHIAPLPTRASHPDSA